MKNNNETKKIKSGAFRPLINLDMFSEFSKTMKTSETFSDLLKHTQWCVVQLNFKSLKKLLN